MIRSFVQPLLNDGERDRQLDENVQDEKQHDQYQAAGIIAAVARQNLR